VPVTETVPPPAAANPLRVNTATAEKPAAE